MAEPTIDLATFKALEETAGADFVKDLVATFLEEAPMMLDDMRGALAARDAEKFRRAAHSLKSNSNTFGALTLGAMAKELELAGLQRALERNPEPLAALVQEYSRVAAALDALRHA
jgi:HPt (histidine-containing phosphotransfer) domain-containing protein